MTAPDLRFGRVMAGSLLIHMVVVAGLILLSLGGGGRPSQSVPIYTVKIVEAPQIPEAQALDRSPTLRKELDLQAPSLDTDAATLPSAPAPDVTGLDAPRLPDTVSPLPPAPNAAAPKAGTAPSQPNATGLVLPAPPALPQPPAPKVSRQAAASAAASSSDTSAASAPPAPDLPDAPTLEDRLRAKVKSLNLKVESAETPSTSDGTDLASQQKSLISLRLFQNTVRERVKQNYTFPGSFPDNLHARVRVVIERSGKLQSAELVDSSGNERFDRLVCMNAIRNAKYPPLPEGIEGDTHTLFLTCSP